MKKFFQFMWGFLRTAKYLLAIPIIFALFLAIHESLSPYLLKIIIDKMTLLTNDSSYMPIILLVVLYVVLTEVVNILFRMRDLFKLKVFPKIKNKIIVEVYKHLLNQTWAYFQDNFVGDLVNKIADLTKGVETIFMMLIDVFLWRIFSVLIAGIIMSLASPYFGVLVFTWAVIFVFGTIKLSKKTHLDAKAFTESRSLIYGKINDSLTNILNIILHRAQGIESKMLQTNLAAHMQVEKKMLAGVIKIGLFQGFAVTILSATLMVLLCYCKINNLITMGDFAFVIIVSGTIIRNIYAISSDLLQFAKELGTCVSALDKTLKVPASITEHNMAVDLTAPRPEIIFHKVRFGYSANICLFENLNLKIAAGEKIGLVGHSGCGKTSFCNLIARLYDPISGYITIDGHDLTKIKLNSLSKNITCISQEPILFNRSFYDNILFGKPNANTGEIFAAAELALCQDFILSLPNGYQTIVGERGIKLSGGQKQRIALARAFLRKSPIIILDEATSALDSILEAKLQNNLLELFSNSTVIVIAHRLSTLQKLDRILVMERGCIIEQGTHAELLQKNGKYQRLWQLHSYREEILV